MKEQNNDEIDLVFVIKQVFLMIKRTYKNIIHNLLVGLLFFKKNAIKLLIGSLLGSLIAYGVQFKASTTYTSQMLIKPNFNTTSLLYDEIEFINELITTKDTNSNYGNLGLGKDFFQITGIEILPLMNYKEEQNLYQAYLQSVDTNFVSNLTSFKEFKDNLEDINFDFHYIKIYSDKRIDFSILDKSIIKKLNNSEYFDQVQQSTIKGFQKEIASLEKIIKQYQAFQEKSQIDSNRRIASTVYIGNDKSDIVDLYDRQIKTREKITSLHKEINSSSNVLDIINGFNAYGKIDQPFKLWKIFIISFVATLIVLLFIELNKKLKSIELEQES